MLLHDYAALALESVRTASLFGSTRNTVGRTVPVHDLGALVIFGPVARPTWILVAILSHAAKLIRWNFFGHLQIDFLAFIYTRTTVHYGDIAAVYHCLT